MKKSYKYNYFIGVLLNYRTNKDTLGLYVILVWCAIKVGSWTCFSGQHRSTVHYEYFCLALASLWHLAYVTQSALGSGILKENQNQASMEQRWWGRLSIQVLGSSRVSYRSQTAEARVLNPVSLCSLNKKYWMRKPWETAAKRSRCEPRLPLSSQGTTFVSSTSRNLSIFTSTVH